ncbi:MAG TPA: type IV toxin-antitoxin system AbiEi family antitoxin [Spirochaetota bacterium]|nr:type IV toxin-antitoxin system AbiEi family antitoxin [Spirochaetota bacterium]HRZ28338.1 type IV toxin-antitoxin system AbiEi family antitoxin [Spirochaetota bacterium]HSA15268.1 type IV toxin-antitoxin system AbiEi family antitoxin [Spirochaetota bacterium]
MKQFKDAGIRTSDVRLLVESGVIDKIKPGLYRLAGIPETGGVSIDMIDAARAVPSGVICLSTALSYHGLTTYNPSSVDIAIPNNARPRRVIYPPLRTYFFRKRYYNLGIETINTPYGAVKIYDREKTLCDMFRYRKKIGEDLAIEGLREYLSGKKTNLNKLRRYAELCSVKTVITPYIKSLAGI